MKKAKRERVHSTNESHHEQLSKTNQGKRKERNDLQKKGNSTKLSKPIHKHTERGRKRKKKSNTMKGTGLRREREREGGREGT